MEYTRAKWTRYGGHMARAEGEHNSNQISFTDSTTLNFTKKISVRIPCLNLGVESENKKPKFKCWKVKGLTLIL